MAQFKGADGEEYALRLSLGALRRFERKTGKKLLKICFGSVRAMSDKSESELTDGVLDGLGQLFESVDDAARLVYECSVARNDQAEMDFETFCDDVLNGAALVSAAKAVFAAVTEHLNATVDAAGLVGDAAANPTKAGG